MELKFDSCDYLVVVEGWFNRTFMELKLLRMLLKTMSLERFNRTFMELKSGISLRLPPGPSGLIVPLWN